MFVSKASALKLVLIVLPTASVVACGGQPPPTAQLAAVVPAPRPVPKHPIEGVWRLVQFDSRDPLDPPLEGFVAGELGQLEVWLSSGRLYATGELVNTVCDYRIDEFDGREFALTLSSENTSWSAVTGRLEENQVFFDALDVPWVGSGRFTREAGR